MFDEVKTVRQYWHCLDTNRSALWTRLCELDSKGVTNTADYHRTIAAWSTYDTAIVLLEELVANNPSLIQDKES